jgi:ribose transport system substrate-binding protein
MRSTRRRSHRLHLAFAALLVLAVALTACGDDEGEVTTTEAAASTTAGTSTTAVDDIGADLVLNGWALPEWLELPAIEEMTSRSDPDGDAPVWYHEMQVTPEQVLEIRDQGWKAAFLNWSGAAYNQAVEHGIRDTFAELGIELVAVTNFEFDAAKAQSDVLNVLPLEPDILITGVLDTSQWAPILQPALDIGTTIMMWSQGAAGWSVGEEICAIASYDAASTGATVADGIHKRYPDGAKVGIILWDIVHPVVNERDQGFIDQLESYGNLEVVATMMMEDPAKAESVASAMITRYPEVEVIYAPWDSPPGEGIVAAIRAAGRTDIKVATMDLGFTGAAEIASDDPIIFHDTAQAVYEGGRTLAIAAALCRLGVEVPPYMVVPTYGVDASNLNSGWLYMHGPGIVLPEDSQIPGT